MPCKVCVALAARLGDLRQLYSSASAALLRAVQTSQSEATRDCEEIMLSYSDQIKKTEDMLAGHRLLCGSKGRSQKQTG